MRPSPLSALDIPKDWPTHGEIDGQRVDLREAWATMSYMQISSIAVDLPGKGKRWPWKQQDFLGSYILEPGAASLLPRASLAALGVTDQELEAWAFAKHGIALDLHDDVPDTQRIRANALRRFLSETK